MRERLIRLIVVVFAVSSGFSAVFSPPDRKLIIISWDGTPVWTIDKLLKEGKLPNLARMTATGVRAEYVSPATPSKTAAGHAAIWTGAFADINGVSGNTIPVLPRVEHTVLETFDGFDSRALHAEPIWMTALRAGKTVTGLSGPQQSPSTVYTDTLKREGISTARYISFDGFRKVVNDGQVTGAGNLSLSSSGKEKETTLRLGDTTFKLTVFDSPEDPTKGYDSAQICAASDCGLLKPAEAGRSPTKWSKAFRVSRDGKAGFVYFRLFSLAPDASEMTLYSTANPAIEGSASDELINRYLVATGGFPDFANSAYQKALLGPVLGGGGEGAAERRLLEIVRFSMDKLDRGFKFAMEELKSDLIIDYVQIGDNAGHLWMGALDPTSGVYDAAMAARIWPLYTEVMQLQDEWLGHILDMAGDNAVVSLVSDHGMQGVSKAFYPNVVLETAGLLARTADNKIDLTRTKVCTPPWADYEVIVNSTDWKGGIVPPNEKENVLRQATEALLSALDPETGRHIVTRVFRPTDMMGFGMGGETSGDLYLDFADGYVPKNAVDPRNVVQKLPLSIGGGDHGFFPQRMNMQTIWFATGPGIIRGKSVGPIRQIDIAPTLSRLFGIPAPANAKGHVIGEALVGP